MYTSVYNCINHYFIVVFVFLFVIIGCGCVRVRKFFNFGLIAITLRSAYQLCYYAVDVQVHVYVCASVNVYNVLNAYALCFG
uniref:Uncharacterized protein n=1 Tax=Glossina palpalis gambiensis TaxID=67801 RepID=A0A1B0B2V8_9MUSC